MLDRAIVLGRLRLECSRRPVAAQAPAPASTTTAFDGTYAGVSRTFLESEMSSHSANRACPPNGQPAPLTIAGGVVRWLATEGGTAEGSVNAQGVLVVHAPYGGRVDARIDGRGAITGRLTSYCSYQLVW
jgi:hypothetical protein